MIPYSDPRHTEIVKELEDQDQWLEECLQPIWQKHVDYWSLYYGYRKDDRKDHEKWRAKLHVPYPYSTARTVIASVVEILSSIDPPVQVEGVEGEDVAIARGIERLVDYTLRRNAWPRTQERTLTAVVVQGFEFLQFLWGEQSRWVYLDRSRREVEDFTKIIKDAEAASGTKMPADVDQFHKWRDEIRKVYPAIRIPDVPLPGPRQILRYRGPMIRSVPVYDVVFDPLVEEWGDQPVVRRRTIKTQKWVEDRTGPGDDKPFDPEAVAAGMAAADTRRLQDWQTQVATVLGISTNTDADPSLKNAAEIKEYWVPDGEDVKHAIVLNRSTIINKQCEFMPFGHGEIPLLMVRNIPIPHFGHGMSEFAQSEKLFHELTTHRELGLDSQLLQVLPVLARLKDAGMSEAAKYWRPGSLIDVPVKGGLEMLSKGGIDLGANLGLQGSIKADIDEASATYQNVRGAPAVIGRVSATESEGRRTQALITMKLRAVHFQEELTPGVRQIVALWAERGHSDERRKIAGIDPLKGISREDLINSLEWDVRFSGATKAVNREMVAQQLVMALDKFGADLLPIERRKLGRLVLEHLQIKQIDSVFTAAGDKVASAPPPMPDRPGAPPPGVVPPQVAAALDREADAEQPAPQEAPVE